jgi:hypothetical protein
MLPAPSLTVIHAHEDGTPEGRESIRWKLLTNLPVKDLTSAIEKLDWYAHRWKIELDLRSIKMTLQMDLLRCRTPELVRKEIWTHVLAHNLIRRVMAQAATIENVEPRSISSKATLQLLEALRPLIAYRSHSGAHKQEELYEQLLGPSPSTASPNCPTGSSPA